MKRIYGIVIIDIAKERENKLSKLLGEDDLEYKPEYFVLKNYSTSNVFNAKIRAFRSVKGAINEVNRCNTIYENKQIRYPNARMINNVYSYYFTFDSSQYSFSYIDITDKWNELVNIDIDRENIRHEKEIVKLNKKLVK